MKKIVFLLFVALAVLQGNTQVFYANGAGVTLSSGGTLWVKGNAQIQNGSTLTNNGTFTLTGDLTNNAIMADHYTGTLVLNGSTAQAVNGSAVYLANHLTINNGAGVTLNNSVKIAGTASFNNGIVHAPDIAKPLVFTANATAAAVSDASHVNGYVVKEGIGAFAYPVGDGTSYQPVDVNAIANNTGIRVIYHKADAGNAPFTGASPLLYYNTLENWDITPLTTATGTVTIYWNDYQNVGIGNIADLRVAHLTGGTWLNENAGTTTGSVTAGSVTSDVVSSWGIFTLGSMSISSTLPVNWLSVNGSITPLKQSVIKWRVNEYNVSGYQVEKSDNGDRFAKIVTITGKGNGDNLYTFTDPAVLQQLAFYRIKQTDFDGKFSYSSVVKLSGAPFTELIAYPMPFRDNFTVISPVAQTARITAVTGAVMQTIQLKQGSNIIGTTALSNGVYFLITAGNSVKKIIKH